MAEVIGETQNDVAQFEDPLPQILGYCSGEEVKRVSEITDPVEFAVGVYAIVRRLEAAAAKYAHENELRIIEASARVKPLVTPIYTMEEQIQGLEPKSLLEVAGHVYLRERFQWAKWILNQRLFEWGY